MKRTATVIPIVLFLLLAFAAPQPGAGQSPGGTRSPPADSAGKATGRTMVFEREVFNYPARERRNPFLPVGVSAAVPRAGDVSLLGIIHHPDSAYSLVVLGFLTGIGGIGDANGAAAGPQDGWTTTRLRLGGALGGLRIAEIHEDHVVIETDESDRVAVQVLAIPRPVGGRGS